MTHSIMFSLIVAVGAGCGPDDVLRHALLGDATFPEGIAAHPGTGELFVGGLASRDIQRVQGDGASYFADGLLNVIGMTVDPDRHRLWVCTSSFADPTVAPVLHVFDTRTADLIASFSPPDDGLPHFFNDVATDPAGNAYVTDSTAPVVYRVDSELGELAPFATDPGFIVDPAGFNLNGIAITPDARFAIVSAPTLSGEGGKLFRISLADGSAVEIPVDPAFGSVDGLVVLGDDRLLGTGGRPNLHALAFDDDYARVDITPIDAFDDALDFATTGALLGDRVWVVSSQLDHFVGLADGPPRPPFEIVGVPVDRL